MDFFLSLAAFKLDKNETIRASKNGTEKNIEALSVYMRSWLETLKHRKRFYIFIQNRALNRFPSSGSPARQHQSGMCNRKSDLL